MSWLSPAWDPRREAAEDAIRARMQIKGLPCGDLEDLVITWEQLPFKPGTVVRFGGTGAVVLAQDGESLTLFAPAAPFGDLVHQTQFLHDVHPFDEYGDTEECAQDVTDALSAYLDQADRIQVMLGISPRAWEVGA